VVGDSFMDKNREKLLMVDTKRLVEIIKEKYSPEKIILFGSLVNGNVKSTSDIDILIIKKTNKRFFERLREVAILCKINSGADILVYTPEEFEEEIRDNIFVREEIYKKGKVIFDAAA
jgi:predicted nucleotidyltransferase